MVTRTKVVAGPHGQEIIAFTAEENAQRDAEEKTWSDARPVEDWKTFIQGTDSGMPRYLEDLITNNASLVIPTEMKERYDAKIKIRGEKP